MSTDVVVSNAGIDHRHPEACIENAVVAQDPNSDRIADCDPFVGLRCVDAN